MFSDNENNTVVQVSYELVYRSMNTDIRTELRRPDELTLCLLDTTKETFDRS